MINENVDMSVFYEAKFKVFLTVQFTPSLYFTVSISVHLCLLFSAEYKLVPYTHTMASFTEKSNLKNLMEEA